MKITHIPQKYPSHKQYRIQCPDCRKPGTRGKTLSVDPVEKVYHCHLCKQGGKLDSDTTPPSQQRIDAAARAGDSRRREQERASRKARQLFGQARETGSSPYLERKQVAGYGVRYDAYEVLLIPVRDAAGKILTVQRIYPDGQKRFMKGAPKKGGYHLIPGDTDGPILLAEGYATAASLHQATGYTAVCAFDLGNLGPVFEALQTLHPERELILCADNDKPNPHNPNPGILAAIELSRQYGCRVAWPQQQGTDFNDLHVAAGLDAVRERVEQAQAVALPDRGSRSYKQQLPRDLHHLEHSHPLAAGWIARKLVSRYRYTCPRQRSLASLLALIEGAAPAGTDLTPARNRVDRLHKYTLKQALAPVSISLEAYPEVELHRIDSLDGVGEQIADLGGVHIIKAPMGSGKTQYIGSTLVELSPSLLAVAHSRALVADLSRRLRLVSYTDVETQDDASGCAYLGTCVNSLVAERLQPALDSPHTVFIDEATQVLNSVLTGDHMQNRAEVYAKLGQVSAQADTLVLADADANDGLLDWVKTVRPGEPVHVWLMPESYAHITLRHRRDGKPVATALELADAGPLLVCTDSKEQAATIHGALQAQYPGRQGLLITADTTGEPEVRAFTRHPSQEARWYDWVVYSPAISSGVSIEVPHFSQHLAVYTGTVKPSDMLQMMLRDRTARQIELVLQGHLGSTGSGNADQLLQGMATAANREQALLRYIDGSRAWVTPVSPFDEAWAAQQAANNRSRKAPHNDLLLQAKGRGFSMSTIDKGSGGGIDREAKKRHREQFSELLLSAPDIDADTAASIQQGRCLMTPERAMELHRFECRMALAVDAPTQADAELYDRGAIVPRINRLLLLHIPDEELALRDLTTLGTGVSTLSDVPTRLAYQDALAKVLADLGIDPETLEGTYTAADAEQVRQDWLPRADELAALGIVNLPPHEPANKTRWVATLLHRIGLRAVTAKRAGPRGDRARVYQVDPARRAALLDIVARRLVHNSQLWGIKQAPTHDSCTDLPGVPITPCPTPVGGGGIEPQRTSWTPTTPCTELPAGPVVNSQLWGDITAPTRELTTAQAEVPITPCPTPVGGGVIEPQRTSWTPTTEPPGATATPVSSARGRGSEQATAHELPADVNRMLRSYTINPAALDALPAEALPDDRRYLRELLRRAPSAMHIALLAMYRMKWERAAQAEPMELRRANTGRRAANSWVRRAVDRLTAPLPA